MCFLLCYQLPAHILGHKDRYVLFTPFKTLRNHLKMSEITVITFLTLDATLEGSSMGYLTLPEPPEPGAFPAVVHVSEVKASHQIHSAVTRRRRNVLFPSGVKLCAQETAEQVVAHHLSFFHLRGEAGSTNLNVERRRLNRRWCPKKTKIKSCWGEKKTHHRPK